MQVVVLDGVPHRGVRGAIAVVGTAALHHLEEHAAHGGGVEVQEFTVGVLIIVAVTLDQWIRRVAS